MPFCHRAFVLFLALAFSAGAALGASQGAQDDGTVPLGPPHIDGISPEGGPRAGGTRIVLQGGNLAGPIKVWLGFRPCNDIRILSPSELQCRTPAHPFGTVDLLVKTPRAFILRREAFTYAPDLRISPETTTLLEGETATFRASGGVPPYKFTVLQGTSSIDAASGALSAANTPEVGLVKVEDSSGESTEASYRIRFPLSVYPESAEIQINQTVGVVASGGVPPYHYELASGAGRFIPDQRLFVAPDSAGQAVIEVTDSRQQSKQVTVKIDGLPPIPPRVVALGDRFSCAAPEGAVSCWGSGFSDVSTPLKALQSGVDSIVSGKHHTCVLVAGAVKCWGSNEYGQLGDGTNASSDSPRQVIGLEAGVLAIAAGDEHTCAVLSSATVCWGRGDRGQLGDGTSLGRPFPAAVAGLDGRVTAIAAGASHTCAVMDGQVKCWGSNRHGELGTGNRIDQWSPVSVDGLDPGVQAISAGRSQTCAATASALKCWGFNGEGNLGASTAADKTRPYDVRIQGPVSVLTSRQYHSCAIVSGSLYCWGYNYQGEVGDSSYLNRWAPSPVSGIAGPVRDVATADFHSCAVTVDNHVYCWGDDYYGELGDGQHARQTSPVRVITGAEQIQLRRKAREHP